MFLCSGEVTIWQLLTETAMLNGGRKDPSAEVVRAALEADPDEATRPFAPSFMWGVAEGELVRLKPGLGEKKGLRAGELATVTRILKPGAALWVERRRDGMQARPDSVFASRSVGVFDS